MTIGTLFATTDECGTLDGITDHHWHRFVPPQINYVGTFDIATEDFQPIQDCSTLLHIFNSLSNLAVVFLFII